MATPNGPASCIASTRGRRACWSSRCTDDARDELISQLATHSVDRHYAALTWGHFETPSGTIDAPVGRSRRDPLKMTVQADGRPARTHYDVRAPVRGARR